MAKFIIKRLLLSIVIFFFVMFIIYTLEYSLPTSYVDKMARQQQAKPGNTKSFDEIKSDLNAKLGMDKGVVGGYFSWLGHLVRLDFGDSWWWTDTVFNVFKACIWYSFFLSLIAFILELVIAIPLGVLAARKQYRFTDYFVTVIAMVCISLPTFFIAVLLKYLFAILPSQKSFPEWLKWMQLPLSGMGDARTSHMLSGWAWFKDLARHYVLPVITLTIISIGGLMRYTRTNMLEVLNADYIRTARAKGLPEKKVINRHAFRNTLIPLVTILGSSLPGLFGGALITETLFGLRGIGYRSYNSMTNGDIPFTMFYLAFSAILTLLGNMIADILYAVVDPRVRIS